MVDDELERGEIDPRRYVKENNEQLISIIKHSNNRFVRGLCLAALVKYGEGKTEVDQIKKELDQLRKIEKL